MIPHYCTAHPVLRIITRKKYNGGFPRTRENGRLETHGWEKEAEIWGKEGKDS